MTGAGLPAVTHPPWRQRFHSAIDALIYALSVYGVPAVIGLVTLVALLVWDSQYENGGSTALALAVIEERGAALTPAQAAEQLRGAPAVPHHDTRLSEAQFWFAFSAAEGAGGVDVELPSRHALQVECWSARTLEPVGSANRSAASGRVRAIKAGFAIALGRGDADRALLCRGTFAGPARISALQWPAGQLATSAQEYHRNAGLLEGGLLVLSAFVLVMAIINREWLHVLLAAWLLASLRMGALSAGWDTQWLGRTIPPDWILLARKLTIAAYFVLTYALFARLFRDDLRKVGSAWLLDVAQWSCVVMLAAALALPFAQFLPVMWVTVGVGIAAIVFLLARLLLVTRSAVAMWYAASLAIVLFVGIYEVLAASLGVKVLIGAVNHVTAALSSSLLCALAIAEQMRQERLERMQAQAALKNAYEVIPIGLFTLARDGAFERVNPALAAMLGAEPAHGERRYWRDHFEPGSWDRLQDLVRKRSGGELEIRGVARAGGAPRWYHVKAALTGERIEGSLQDFTERLEATATLHFLAENDPLTGVLNRRGVEKVLAQATQEAAAGRPLAVAYLDLDRFKLINDLFGHVAGDEVLRQASRRIEALLAEGHALGRIGGDEFVIVFRGAPIQSAAAICRGIVEAIGGAAFQTGDKAFQVRISIGLVEVAGPLAVKDAISVADRACRDAKAGAGEGLVVYQRGARVLRDREQELRLVERLGAGVAPEGLFLMMQPIMSLRAPYGSLDFEVLVRMREADGSVTPAGVIIAAAENNGRAAVIDRWVLSNTLAWLERHRDALATTRFATMNLSGASLNDEKFVQDAFAMLRDSPRAVERLCIEITEGVALHDLGNTKRFIERVRGFGAKLALDDFGAGYTSFSYLKELPADALKIDGSFIQGVNAHPANLAIVEAIVELGRNFGMQTIAEWAEDRATVEALAQIGVDYVQGFAIARPQDPEQLLGASSAAGFITDPDVLRYVRDTLAPARTLELWDPLGEAPRAGMH
jgi:diguanylate cyclase (GGDEF)-like protein